MEYKRFSAASFPASHNAGAQSSEQLVESVSQIEIGSDDVTVSVETPAVRGRRFAAVFFLFLFLAAGFMLAFPFTGGGNRVLSIAASLLTADSALLEKRVESLLIPLGSGNPGTDSSHPASFSLSVPAADSAVIDVSSPDSAPPPETSPVSYEDTVGSSDIQTVSISTSEKLTNETAYTVELDVLSQLPYPIAAVAASGEAASGEEQDAVSVFGESQPQVLILHTHGTECYADSQSGGSYRCRDTEKNVVRVGRELAEVLTQRGLSVIHCEEMFDEDSFIKAYSNSYNAVREYLDQYPSIRYVIDLHRDAVSDGHGGYADLSVSLEGESCAQMMLVVGTDEAGAKHPEWRNNLRVALQLQTDVQQRYPGLMRPLNLRRASFNQQLSPGYFLLETGSCGGTMEEALRSIRLFGGVFADTVTAGA